MPLTRIVRNPLFSLYGRPLIIRCLCLFISVWTIGKREKSIGRPNFYSEFPTCTGNPPPQAGFELSQGFFQGIANRGGIHQS